MTEHHRPRRALLSVSDKTGVLELAQALLAMEIQLISTGGTAKLLRDAGLAVTDVAQITEFPEIMDGRVKTLHPRIHGGLLGRLGLDDGVMQAHGIEAIDLLVVNLYPFAQTIARTDVSLEDAIENIDIGGPAMLRAAAKNHERVMVLTDASDYGAAIKALHSGENTLAWRRRLAAKAYAHTAQYDGRVASYLGSVAEQAQTKEASTDFPPSLHLSMHRAEVLRYGENPHQRAALYVESPLPAGCVASAQFRQGKSLSYNNIADADAALECVKLFEQAACVIVKHANPCGVAEAGSVLKAYELAYQTDTTSAFGGIIAFNRPLDGETARLMVGRQFIEVVIAPEYSADALAALAGKPNIRVLATGSLTPAGPWRDFKRIQGGLLVQDGDLHRQSSGDYVCVSTRQPTAQERADLLFAWKVAMQVKSNAIVYAKDLRSIGIGAGQMSRVISAKIAGIKAADAKLVVAGAVMASDAFFPFRDGIDAAAEAGVTAVIQPGGSMRDSEVIEAANQHGMSMLFTGIRHFKH